MNSKHFWTDRRLAWLLLVPMLLACDFITGAISRNDATDVPAQAETVPADQPEAPSIAGPTATKPAPPPTPPISPSPTGASPRQTAEATLLPAPLYFIGQNAQGQAGQIMRLEATGLELQQITDEPEGIFDFDVSPVDGRLVYVSGNKLIETGPNGDNPIVKVDAGPITVDPTAVPAEQARISQRIDKPRFSPDGGQIVFGLNGVNLILAGAATEYAVLLPSDPYPDPNNPAAATDQGPIRFYWPDSWSPDGRRLLIQFAYYPEAGGLAVYDLASGEWNPVTNADGIECCDWAWSPDSEIAFLASDLLAYGRPGLAQVSTTTGGSQTLINGAPDTPGVTGLPPNLQVFKAPLAAGDGRLLLFTAIGYQDEPLQPMFHMAEVTAGVTQTVPLRDDAYFPVEVLWAPDGRGAVLVNPGPNMTIPVAGPLLWLPTDGGPAVNLPAVGGALRWGPALIGGSGSD